MARRALITAAIAAVAAALLVAPAAPARAEAVGWWPSEGYTVTNNGFNPNETAIRVPTVGGLVAKSATTPERRGQGAPVVGHGRVFVPDALGITAYDEITGAQLWRWENDAERSLTPILALTGDGKLVAVTRYAAVDYSSHALVVFDEVTGEALVNTGIEVEGFAWRLLVDGDFVVVSGENRHALDTHTYRLSTGALLWEHDLYMYQPVSAGGRLLVRGWRDNVLTSEILDIATGAARFGVQHRGYDVLRPTTRAPSSM